MKSKMDRWIQISSWISGSFLAGAFACVWGFRIIGQKIDSEGILHEPFFLIPLFWLFVVLTMITVTVNASMRIIRHKRRYAMKHRITPPSDMRNESSRR